MNFITLLEYLGVFAFSISGASIAIREKFDLFGIFILATVTAMGGGIIRDIVTDVGIPVFFSRYDVIPFIILGIVFAIIFRKGIKYELLYIAIDAIGLSAFVISAGSTAIHNRYNFMLFLFSATITGVGGGIFRDILARRKPMVLRAEIYSVAGMIGAVVLWFTHSYIGFNLSALISIIIIFSIRMISYMTHINLPVIRTTKLNI